MVWYTPCSRSVPSTFQPRKGRKTATISLASRYINSRRSTVRSFASIRYARAPGAHDARGNRMNENSASYAVAFRRQGAMDSIGHNENQMCPYFETANFTLLS